MPLCVPRQLVRTPSEAVVGSACCGVLGCTTCTSGRPVAVHHWCTREQTPRNAPARPASRGCPAAADSEAPTKSFKPHAAGVAWQVADLRWATCMALGGQDGAAGHGGQLRGPHLRSPGSYRPARTDLRCRQGGQGGAAGHGGEPCGPHLPSPGLYGPVRTDLRCRQGGQGGAAGHGGELCGPHLRSPGGCAGAPRLGTHRLHLAGAPSWQDPEYAAGASTELACCMPNLGQRVVPRPWRHACTPAQGPAQVSIHWVVWSVAAERWCQERRPARPAGHVQQTCLA